MSMRAVVLNGFGPRTVLSVSSTVPKPSLRPGEVLVKVGATAVNRGDIMQRKGHYPPPPGASSVLGLEFAGCVVEQHPSLSSTQDMAPRVGARVMGIIGGGGYAEYVTVSAKHCLAIPDNMSMVEAAATTEAFLTAFQAIHHHAALHPDPEASAKHANGERARPGPDRLGRPYRMLVHAGASGVGLAACQVGRHFGIDVITTSSAAKVDECARFASFGAVSRTPNSEGVAFRDKVQQLFPVGTAPDIDLIIDPVFGAQYAAENGAVLAKDGVVVVLSFLGGAKLDKFDAVPYFAKRATIKFSTLRSQSDEYKAGLTAAFARLVLPALAAKSCRPNVSTVLKSLDEAAEGHRLLEENIITGKCVIVVDPSLQ